MRDPFHYQISKLDLFGKEYTFEEKDHMFFHTLTGNITTILILIACSILGFISGKDIYERKYPVVVSSDDKIENSRFSIDDFPILFAYITGTGRNVPEAKKYITMNVTFMIVSEDLVPTTYYIPGYKKCNASEFNGVYKDMVDNEINNSYLDFYCINYEGLYILNDFTTRNSAYVNVRFHTCDAYSSDYECGEIEGKESAMNDLYIYYVYYKSYINPNNFANPYNYFSFAYPQQISEGLLKRNYLSIERRKLITDKGWILEEKNEEEYLTERITKQEVNVNDYGHLFWMTIDSPNIRNQTSRNYLKIQDLLAKIGGLFNAFMIIGSILIKNYVDFSFYKNIYDHFSDDKVKNLRIKTSANNVGNAFASNTSNLNLTNNKNNINQSKGSFYRSYTIDKVVKCIKDTIRKESNIEKVVKDFNNDNPQENNDNDNYTKIKRSSKLNNIYNSYSNNINQNVNANKSNAALTNNYVNASNYQFNNNVNNNSNLNLNNVSYSHINREFCQNIYSNKTFDKTIKSISSISQEKKLMLKESKSKKDITYFSYLWNDLLCCKKKFYYIKLAVRKVISFNNLMEVSYKYYVKYILNIDEEVDDVGRNIQLNIKNNKEGKENDLNYNNCKRNDIINDVNKDINNEASNKINYDINKNDNNNIIK